MATQIDTFVPKEN